eukprot:scaffold240598_cov18-Tisochrysis_lutea.AAC.1
MCTAVCSGERLEVYLGSFKEFPRPPISNHCVWRTLLGLKETHLPVVLPRAIPNEEQHWTHLAKAYENCQGAQ